MLDDFNKQTEKFLHRWVPSKELIASMPQAGEETPEQMEKRLELFMQKVESQAQEELAKRKASRFYQFFSEFVSARLQHPSAVTALIISICAVLFMTVAKYNRRELHEAVSVSFPADEALKDAESTIELLRAGSRQLESSPDPTTVASLNIVIRQKYRDGIKPKEEELPPTVRARLAEMVLVYNDSLTQWRTRNESAHPVRQNLAPLSIETDDSEKVAAIYEAVAKDNPANADILKNASIVSISEDENVGKSRWEWLTDTDPQSWDEASFRQSANRTDTILRIRDQRGNLREFTPSQGLPFKAQRK